jgi:putative MATE family efflux protein
MLINLKGIFMNLVTGNTNKLYFTLLISALGSTVLTTIYTTVDIICVGQYLGPLGSAALACLNPFWTVMFAPGILFGIGGAVMMSNKRGAGDENSARKYFTVSTILSILCAGIVFLIMSFFMEEMLVFFGAEGDTLTEAKRYMAPIKYAAPTFTLSACLSTFIRNDGEAVLPTVATLIGGAVNVFTDIFFVFDFGLGLGIYGAGLATSISQILSFLIMISYFFTKKCNLRFTKIDNFAKRISKIVTVGFSVFLAELSLGLVFIFFNKLIVDGLGNLHLAIYGTVSTVAVLLQSLYNTLGTALQPIASAGYGAKDFSRVNTVFKTSIICSIVFGAIFTLFTQFFPLEILKAYMDVDDGVVRFGPSILRIYTVAIGVSGISIVISFYFQSILKRTLSTALTLLRGLVLPCIFAVLLTQIFGINAIWFAVPLAELITMALSVFLVFISRRQTRDTK